MEISRKSHHIFSHFIKISFETYSSIYSQVRNRNRTQPNYLLKLLNNVSFINNISYIIPYSRAYF